MNKKQLLNLCKKYQEKKKLPKKKSKKRKPKVIEIISLDNKMK